MANAAIEDAERPCAAGECETAIELFERAVRLEPCDFRLHYRLGLCYGGGCRAHSLVHPDMALAYLRQTLRLVGADRGRFRAGVMDQLGNTLCHSGSTPGAVALRAAIECHIETSEIYRSLGMADDWGRTLFNLGNSCCELSEITGEDHWQEAVFQYEQSLRIRTRWADPGRYAATLENLGTAYRRLPAADGSNVNNSIKCYRQAMHIYAAAAYPDENASLHNHLGNAFLSLPGTDAGLITRNARRALRHFDHALRIQSTNGSSCAYGITRYNRAQAHYRLTQTSPGGNPKVAVTCLEEAFAAFQSCREDRYTQLVRAQLKRTCRSSSA